MTELAETGQLAINAQISAEQVRAARRDVVEGKLGHEGMVELDSAMHEANAALVQAIDNYRNHH